MATLHIVNKPTNLASCLTVAEPADAILLIEDGVYAVPPTTTVSLKALREDVLARGMKSHTADSVTLISYEEFVDLVVAHQPVVSWT